MAGPDRSLRWPEGSLDPAEFTRQWLLIRPAFLNLMHGHRLPDNLAESLAAVYLPLAAWIISRGLPPAALLGVNGAQGSGKSTLCDFLAMILAKLYGLRVAVLSIDDLYHTRAEREQLARDRHPLLVTRGVPGTHDLSLGSAVIGQLRQAADNAATALPSFDKARDDRWPPADWPVFRGKPELILFEGWCVGSTPQSATALIEPVNDLEREEDPARVWRTFVNEQLRGDYAGLFGRLDGLIMLKVPGMASVYEWRGLQERKLAATHGGQGLMDAMAIRRFIMHYERLTRHNLAEMPARADLTLHLDRNHCFAQVTARTPNHDSSAFQSGPPPQQP